jgi:hypothetical protein
MQFSSTAIPEVVEEVTAAWGDSIGSDPGLTLLQQTHLLSSALLRTQQPEHSQEPAAGLNLLMSESLGCSVVTGTTAWVVAGAGAACVPGLALLHAMQMVLLASFLM